MVKTALIFKQAVFGYQKNRVTQIDYQVPVGQFVAMVGKNGVGKSTVIKTICGQQPLLSGQVMVNTHSVSELTVPALAQNVAAVFTSRVSGFHLTPREVIASARMPYTNWTNQLSIQDEQLIDAVMKQYAIESFADRPLNQLSDGMYQRVMLARAVAQETPLLLLDEPTAFLDYASRHEVFELLKNLSREGKTVLISTHDLDLVLKYCDEVLLLDSSQSEGFSVEAARNSQKFMELGGKYL